MTGEVVGVGRFGELEKLGRRGVEGKMVLYHGWWRRDGPRIDDDCAVGGVCLCAGGYGFDVGKLRS